MDWESFGIGIGVGIGILALCLFIWNEIKKHNENKAKQSSQLKSGHVTYNNPVYDENPPSRSPLKLKSPRKK